MKGPPHHQRQQERRRRVGQCRRDGGSETLGNEAALIGVAAQQCENDFQVTDEDINIGISLKKGNTELKEAIDSVLSKMTKDDFSAMMDEEISVQPLAN